MFPGTKGGNSVTTGRKAVLVLGHGSRRQEANQMVLSLVQRLRADLHTDLVEPAFVSLASPDISTSLAALAERGCQEVFVFPLFLVEGNHLARDIPSYVQQALAGYQGMKVTLGQPLLQNPELYGLIMERLERELLPQDGGRPQHPQAIQQESFARIESRLRGLPFAPDEMAVLRRVVHATADFSHALSLRFSPGAVQSGRAALRAGKEIIADARMVKAGIGYRGPVLCYIDEPAVVQEALEKGVTRASLGMERAAARMDGAVVVVGNAPTALFKVIELIQAGRAHPALVIGVPVGLVGALEAKTRLASLSGQPHITNLSVKGGSAMAAAIVNALLEPEPSSPQEGGLA